MPRGRVIKKEPKVPDPFYKSRVVTKLINMIMVDGKKSLAKNIVYNMLADLSEDKKEARQYFEGAVKSVMPNIEVRSRRVGGANYQIPVPVKHDRSETLALRWIIDAARAKKGKSMAQKLTEEIKQAYVREGTAIKKRSNMHKMAEANRAFAHFRW